MKNRLVKFRIWDKQLNHFACEGEYLGSSFGLIEKGFPFYRQAINRDFDSQQEYEKFCEKNFVVQQFTGLLDCNGKEIYEGDILELHHKWETKEPYLSKVSLNFDGCAIVKNDSHQKARALQNFAWKEDYCVFNGFAYCKVIGNIFETPDLL